MCMYVSMYVCMYLCITGIFQTEYKPCFVLLFHRCVILYGMVVCYLKWGLTIWNVEAIWNCDVLYGMKM